MDTEKVKIYLTALETGSFSAAGEKLGYTASGISRSIASLEEEVGISLCRRGKSGVTATEEAACFIPVFRELARQEQRLQETIRKVHGIEQGVVTIGISYAAYYRLIAGKIREFTRRYPGVEIRTIQETSTALLHAMEDHRVDLAVMTKRPGNFEFYELLEDSMVACVSAEDPLAKCPVFPLKRFEELPMVAAYPDRETDYRIALEQHGIRPNIRYSTQDVYAAYCMVEAGLGVSLFNHLEVGSWNGGVTLLPTDPDISLKIGITYPHRSELSLAAQKFLELLL